MAARSLRQSLEQVATLGATYILVDNQGEEHTAPGLLALLTRFHPDELTLLVYLRLPDTQRDGAICQATRSGFVRWYAIRPALAAP